MRKGTQGSFKKKVKRRSTTKIDRIISQERTKELSAAGSSNDPLSPGIRDKSTLNDIQMFRNSKMASYDKREEKNVKKTNKKVISKPYFVSILMIF